MSAPPAVGPEDSLRGEATLPLALVVSGGRARLVLKDHVLAPGLRITFLELELPGIRFPADLTGGAARFQHHQTQLSSAVIEADLPLMSRALTEGLARQSGLLKGLRLSGRGGALEVEAKIAGGDFDGRELSTLVILPDQAAGLRCVLGPVLRIGRIVGPPWLLVTELARYLAAATGHLVEAVRLSQDRLELLPAILAATFPPRGWKVPSFEGLAASQVITAEERVTLVFGDPPADVPLPPPGPTDQALVALARADVQKRYRCQERAHEPPVRLFEDLRAELDSSLGPRALLEWLLHLGTCDPRLYAEAADLARDALALAGATAPVLLSLGGLSLLLGDPRSAGAHFLAAAPLLQKEGQLRGKAYALLFAAKLIPGQDALPRLEEAAAATPDDPEVLRSLAAAMAAAGNGASALSLARRVSKLTGSPLEQAWAHDFAGWQLLTSLRDPIRAKREFERALRLEPERQTALEGLSRALSDHGDPHRAALVLERLYQRALATGDRAKAALWCVELGDRFRAWDGEAALARYTEAAELDPNNVEAVLRLATLPVAKSPAVLDAIELVLSRHGASEPASAFSREQLLALTTTAGRLALSQHGRERDAAAHFEAALDLDPDSSEALEGLLVLRRALGPQSLLIDLLDRVALLRLSTGDASGATAALIEEARLLHGAGADLLPVARRLQEINLESPGLIDASDALVELAELTEQPEVLLQAVDRRLAIGAVPELRAELLARRGEALLSLGRVDEAEATFEAALVIAPSNARVLAGLGAVLRRNGRLDRLAAALGRAAELASGATRATLLTERARALLDAGRTEDAFLVTLEVLEMDPSGGELLPMAVDLAIALGRLDDARAILTRRAAADPPLLPEAQVGVEMELARVARSGGDHDAEIAALERALNRAELLEDPEARAALIADRLSELLAQAGSWAELARLFRRRARSPSAGPRAAEQAFEAARLFARIGDTRAAEDELHFLLDRPAQASLHLSALELLEDLARRSGDPRRIANFLERRLLFATSAEARASIRLEQAEALTRSGLLEEATERLERALGELPRSLEIAQRLVAVAEQLGRLGLAARAKARVAQILEERGDSTSLEAHSRAAEAWEQLGRLDAAARHDLRVLELAPASDGATGPTLTSLRRLERHARTSGDAKLLANVLDRWARAETGRASISRLLEKAELEERRLSLPDDALATLRRAAQLAAGTDAEAEVEQALERLLGRLGRDPELAARLDARAARASDPTRAADLHLAAARLYSQRLAAPAMALDRARAAQKAAPELEEARSLRQRLAVAAGGSSLAESLLDDAAQAMSPEDRVGLSLDAAKALAPLIPRPGQAAVPTSILERALEIAQEAARISPRTAETHLRVASYAQRLGRSVDEFLALGHMVEVVADLRDRLLAQLRRVELLRDRLDDPLGAQGELSSIVASLGELEEDQRARLRREAAPASYLGAEQRGDLLLAAFHLGLALTERNSDWEAHVQYLKRLLEITEVAEDRADLHFRIGDITEWKLGDGDSAERQYLAALAIIPNHPPAIQALSGLYLSVDRFRDLAENLGVDRLKRVWEDLRAGLVPPDRIVAAAEALWPRLPSGSSERADVLLSLADLYRSVRDEAEGAVMLLEMVIREGPPGHEPAALERLRVLFLEEERWDLYVEILRRQAERLESDEVRARALAEIGEALEWRVGDGGAAEREYRSALAVDPHCSVARERLALLLASQDRFLEVGSDLGQDELVREIQALEARGPRESQRLWAAVSAHSAQSPPEGRARLWLDLADHLAEPVERLRATQRAVDEGGADVELARTRLQALKDAAATVAELPAAPSAPELVQATVIEPAQRAPEPLPAVVEPPASPPVLLDDATRIPAAAELPIPDVVVDSNPPDASQPETRMPPWRERVLSAALAARPLPDPVRVLGLARRLLQRRPDRPLLLDALVRALHARGELAAMAGPAQVLRVVAPLGGAPVAPLPPLPELEPAPLLWRTLASEALLSPVGALLARTALPLATLLPATAPGETSPLQDETAERCAVRAVERLLELTLDARVAPGAEVTARLEPGDPPRLLLSAGALEPGREVLARYLIGRSALLLRLGFLGAGYPPAGEQDVEWISAIFALGDPAATERLPAPIAAILEPLRARLGPSGLADVPALVERAGGRADPQQLAEWKESAGRAAACFGVLVAGELVPLVDTLGETREDVLTYFAGEGYARLVGVLPHPESESSR